MTVSACKYTLFLCSGVQTIPSISSFQPQKQNTLLSMNFSLMFQIQKRIEENAAAGRDTASLDDEAFTIEAALDRCILRLIASCCNGESFIRGSLGGNFFPRRQIGLYNMN